MKKGLLLALVLFATWAYFSKKTQVQQQDILPTAKAVTREAERPTSNFKCDGRQYCSQMSSRAEAEFFNKNCPDTKMDGDHDGIPCENDSRF